MLDKLDDGIWCATSELTLLGLPIGARMTVVRLRDDTLLLHSPIQRTDELAEAVSALGDVSVIVAPNDMHHLFVRPWHEAYPQASLWLAPGLPKKRPNLQCDGVLPGGDDVPWRGVLESVHIGGMPKLQETAFYMASTQTLIVTDLLFNFASLPGMWGSIYHRMMLFGEHPCVSRLVRMVTNDKVAARAAIDQIAAWDFQRVVVAHGEVITTMDASAFLDHFSWL